MTENVEKWLPEAVGGGEDAGFAEALAAELRPAALAEFEEAQAAVFLAGAEVGSSPLAPQVSDLMGARLDLDFMQGSGPTAITAYLDTQTALELLE